jgi:hypothetical protein
LEAVAQWHGCRPLVVASAPNRSNDWQS